MTFLEELPNDYGPRGKGFMPYTYKAEKAIEWTKANTLPLIGLIIGITPTALAVMI